MAKRLIVLSIVSVAAFLGIGYLFSIDDIPEHPRSYVLDMAELFSPAEEQQISETIREIDQSTSNQIGVLTVPTLEQYEISQLSINVAEKWGIGTEKADNGILLLIAEEERQRRIEVGYGLEPLIPDLSAKQLGQKYLVPFFRQGKYGEGVLALLDAFVGVFDGSIAAGPYAGSVMNEGGLFLFGLVGFLLAVGIGGNVKPMLKFKDKVLVTILGSTGYVGIGDLILGSEVRSLFLPLLLIWALVLLTKISTTPGRGGRSKHTSGSRSSTNFGGSFGGGFGGFGGGSFGGGGASGSW